MSSPGRGARNSFGKGRVQVKFALAPGLGGVVLSTGTFQRPSGKTFDKHDAEGEGGAGIAPAPGQEVRLEKAARDAWAAEMERLDGPYVLTPEEQEPRVPDPVLARGLEVLAGLLAGRH